MAKPVICLNAFTRQIFSPRLYSFNFRSHHMHSIDMGRSVATDVTSSVVCVSVCCSHGCIVQKRLNRSQFAATGKEHCCLKWWMTFRGKRWFSWLCFNDETRTMNNNNENDGGGGIKVGDIDKQRQFCGYLLYFSNHQTTSRNVTRVNTQWLKNILLVECIARVAYRQAAAAIYCLVWRQTRTMWPWALTFWPQNRWVSR